jgi:hypothetical protein
MLDSPRKQTFSPLKVPNSSCLCLRVGSHLSTCCILSGCTQEGLHGQHAEASISRQQPRRARPVKAQLRIVNTPAAVSIHRH